MYFGINNTSSYPLILLHYSEFAEYIYDSEFKSMLHKNFPAMLWLPHSLIFYIQQHFQAITSISTKPKNIHTTLAGEPLSHKIFYDSEHLFSRIMDILSSCVISNSMGMLSNQLSTYIILYPSTTPNHKAERNMDNPVPKNTNVTSTTTFDIPTFCSNGYLNNSTADKKIPPHTRLAINPCYYKLTTSDCT